MFSIIHSCACHREHWHIRVIVAMLAMFTIISFAVTGCGGGSSSSPTPTIAAPGEPTNFTVIRTPDTILSATLSWVVPTSGGEPTSFEIYRSTTAGSVFQSSNHLISIPVEAGKTSYSFIDNAGLTPADTYWVVSAKNAGGETPTAEFMYKPTTVAAPGEPTNFTVTRTPEATLSATLNWAVPASGGEPTSFEIYRATTAGSVFQSSNHLISIPVEAGKTNYAFIDNAGLTPVDTYWVVSAKNDGGETPTAEVMYKPIGPPGGTGDTGYGNNFSAALVFADGIGISGLGITGSWTTTLADIDTATGLRPTSEQITELQKLPVPVTTLPYFDPTTAYTLNNITYYKQQTISSWQGQWVNGADTPQHVNAAWGDNLVSQSLTATSTIRIEMVLSETLTAPMTSYWMESLYGAKENEIQGTDGTTYDNLTAFVFASNARLKIQKLDADGNPDGAPLYDQTLWQGDGPGYLAGEVNVSGNFTYGFVWNLKNETLPADITTGKTGTWRITFSLDPDNSGAGKAVPPAANNTFIDTVSNGVRVSATEVYIDITVQ